MPVPKHIKNHQTDLAKRLLGHQNTEHVVAPDPGEGKVSAVDSPRVHRVTEYFQGHPIGKVSAFISSYVVMPETSSLVISTWVAAAHLLDLWDRFPHLGISSPEKRCGKTTLLEILYLLVPKPRYTTNISPAALYRIIEAEKPTLLMDESQSLARRGSEQSEVIREILNAGIGPNAKVIRCGGPNMAEVMEFSVYSPKIFAMIGKLDAVLSDRTLPCELRRKAKGDTTKRFRSRVVEPEGEALHNALSDWCEQNQEAIQKVYDVIEPFPIQNDRMADLLTPLQSILTVANGPLELLQDYAESLDERDREQEMQSPGVQLLTACKEIFEGLKFIGTDTLIEKLKQRKEEPWGTWNRTGITREALAKLLRQYDIRPDRYEKMKNGQAQKLRGYYATAFHDAWQRYVP